MCDWSKNAILWWAATFHSKILLLPYSPSFLSHITFVIAIKSRRFNCHRTQNILLQIAYRLHGQSILRVTGVALEDRTPGKVEVATRNLIG